MTTAICYHSTLHLSNHNLSLNFNFNSFYSLTPHANFHFSKCPPTLDPRTPANCILINAHLERDDMPMLEAADGWDWSSLKALSAHGMSTGEGKILSLSTSSSITYSTLLHLASAKETDGDGWRCWLKTINEAISLGLNSAARTASTTDACTLNRFLLYNMAASSKLSSCYLGGRMPGG